MEDNAAFLLLANIEPQLRRIAARTARRVGPGLDADDAYQEIVVRFVERAPKWFAQPPRTSRQAQAVTLLAQIGRHIVTEHNRQRDRVRDDPEPIARARSSTPDAEHVLAQEQVDQYVATVVDELSNPVHGLLIHCVHLPRRLIREHLDRAGTWARGGARPILRPLDEAWGMLDGYRLAPPDEHPARRRHTAITLRCTEAQDAVPPVQRRTAVGWVNRTLYRAMEGLALALDQEMV